MKKTHLLVRLIINFFIAATTFGGIYIYSRMLWTNGGSVLDVMLILVFALLYLWISIAFWIATLGVILCLFSKKEPVFDFSSVNHAEYDNLPRVAILMPIYNEDPSRVFSNLWAIYESVQNTGHEIPLDFFALSDTNDPEIWAAEELAWATARRSLHGPFGFYYRHRQKNIGRKSGNIRDFLEQWGTAYKYMVVLDADSVMDGWTILEITRRMELNDNLGILQVSPNLVSRETLFARIQQFASYIYGKIYVLGYAYWSQGESNYWGHNAIIRVKPFIEHCGLPRLPGKEPLGGEILSHDFVEAALMLRAGWEVRMTSDLRGSYEEPPTTIIDFVGRSRRWCQGNLQHLRLIVLDGFHLISRIYFGMGAMSYLSSLLWFFFIVLTLLDNYKAPTKPISGLWILTLELLFLPKLWGYIAYLHDMPFQKKRPNRVMLSVLLESIISILTVPVFMLFNIRFVITLFLGHGIQWRTQRRDDTSVRFKEAFQQYSLHTLAGVLGLLFLTSTGYLNQIWLLFIIIGLLLSIPLEMCLSSVKLGQKMRKAGLFLDKEEIETPSVLVRQRSLRADMQKIIYFQSPADIFKNIVLDPGLKDMHLALLKAQNITQSAPEKIEALAGKALHSGPEHLSTRERFALLSNSEVFSRLHNQAWKKWNIENL